MIEETRLELVRSYLICNGITSQDLQDDLLDHFCCVIEENMEAGKSFDESLSGAIARVTPDGPLEIQNDLNYLLTVKKNIMLRKLVFTTSYISVFIILLGAAMRIPQIISADLALLLTMVGILLFSVSTVPYFFYSRYMQSVRNLREE